MDFALFFALLPNVLDDYKTTGTGVDRASYSRSNHVFSFDVQFHQHGTCSISIRSVVGATGPPGC